ncbi:hypothetical protein E4U42_006891 [Claviceps africana]|uniref:Uncharacterized protein n=1 Tax=Claviceps africana TaxID=83212 RepID=A0A8K0J1S5_9HYPO|nr:hypothetical protein E4U42_006891 [Claviceps africana]
MPSFRNKDEPGQQRPSIPKSFLNPQPSFHVLAVELSSRRAVEPPSSREQFCFEPFDFESPPPPWPCAHPLSSQIAAGDSRNDGFQGTCKVTAAPHGFGASRPKQASLRLCA